MVAGGGSELGAGSWDGDGGDCAGGGDHRAGNLLHLQQGVCDPASLQLALGWALAMSP